MTDTTDTAKADALMKLAERLRMAPLSGGEYRTAHAELESAIEAAIERARADEREKWAALLTDILKQARHPDYDWPACLQREVDDAIRALGTTGEQG